MRANLQRRFALSLWLLAALPALAQESVAAALRHPLELRGEIIYAALVGGAP